MADFCNNCVANLFRDEHPPDIDIYEIAEDLQEDTWVDVFCEGCGMSVIGKSEEGHVYMAIPENRDAEEIILKWITLDEYIKMSPTII